MDIKATRFNWYKDSSQWKPYHHDAALSNQIKQRFKYYCRCFICSERDVSFQHAKELLFLPLVNNSIYCFNKDVNIEWRHGTTITRKFTK